jgi:hypothetical protein
MKGMRLAAAQKDTWREIAISVGRDKTSMIALRAHPCRGYTSASQAQFYPRGSFPDWSEKPVEQLMPDALALR